MGLLLASFFSWIVGWRFKSRREVFDIRQILIGSRFFLWILNYRSELTISRWTNAII